MRVFNINKVIKRAFFALALVTALTLATVIILGLAYISLAIYAAMTF